MKKHMYYLSSTKYLLISSTVPRAVRVTPIRVADVNPGQCPLLAEDD